MNWRHLDFRYLPRARLIRRLPANDRGRDFVVGDLHGCHGPLVALLDRVGFDGEVDRLFSVGDLGDRGPDSMACLRLLQEPWFHAVMGNHEQLLVNFFGPWLKEGRCPDLSADAALGLFQNGGGWVRNECVEHCRPGPELACLVRAAADLPQVLTVGEGQQRFNVVHAELLGPGRRPLLSRLWRDRELDALPEFGRKGEDFPALRWSREIFSESRGDPCPERAEGLSPTFCGHSIHPTVCQVCSHVDLDTGGYVALRGVPGDSGYGLTLAEPAAGRCFTWRSGAVAEGRLPP